MDMLTKIEELRMYSAMEGTEIGDVCEHLCGTASFSDYISDEFNLALEKEITSQLKNFQENTKIVKNTRTYTRTEEELVWLSENF